MAKQLNQQPALRVADDVLACELGDGLALLHESTGTYFILGDVESLIWQRLSSGATAEDAAEAVKAVYDAPSEEIERDVRAFVQEMADAKLVKADGLAKT